MKALTIAQQKKALKNIIGVRKHIMRILNKSADESHLIPKRWANKINSGEMQRKYGLESDSKSRYAWLRREGYGDTESQYMCYVSRGIIPRPKRR